MKKIFTLLVAILLTVSVIAQTQNYGNRISQNEDGTYFYMRSSLEMVYIDSEYFPNKELVDESWNNYMDPQKNFPNQYNKHGADIGTVELGGNNKLSDKEMANRIMTYNDRTCKRASSCFVDAADHLETFCKTVLLILIHCIVFFDKLFLSKLGHIDSSVT